LNNSFKLTFNKKNMHVNDYIDEGNILIFNDQLLENPISG